MFRADARVLAIRVSQHIAVLMPAPAGHRLYLLLSVDLPVIINVAQVEPVPAHNAPSCGIRFDTELGDD